MHLRNHGLLYLTSLVLATACGGAHSSSAPADVPAPAAPITRPGSFADNPIIYFAVTDRFANGDPSNDHSYGRQREPKPADDIGTFHGGDLRGLTQKVNEGWFDKLGVNAIWITAPYEQIHGWVVGGDKQFKHYAYHGYYALDYTVLDQNMGTPDDLRALVAAAHAKGIRILFDIVMNHPGYLDLVTAKELNVQVLWPGSEKATPADYHQYIDYNNFHFADWWGRAWVRAGLPGYMDGGRDDLTSQLNFLPDFRTESKDAVTVPTFLKNKRGTRAVDLPNTTVRGYLIHWLTDWVREYGIDGFRCDTAKHVEPEAWHELKAQAVEALAEWKAKHPKDKIDDAAFWMVGEFWGHGPERGPLHGAGFDAMLNFQFQKVIGSPIASGKLADLDDTFAQYAKLQHGHPAQMLSYVSSHDTELFDRKRIADGGSALLLAPGAVQIFYGDETARPIGPSATTDQQQGTRSDMNWDKPDEAVLAHWRKLGTFRRRHVALAHGEHARMAYQPYMFSRIDNEADDRVVVALGVQARTPLPMGKVFANGDRLHDAYNDVMYTVANGTVTITADTRAVLLERAK